MADKKNYFEDYLFDADVLDSLCDTDTEEIVDFEQNLPIPGLNGAHDRDKSYTKLLNYYVGNFDNEQKFYFFMRKVFFWTVLGSFLALIICSIGLLVYSLCMKKELVEIIAYATTAVISLVSSIIVLPKIIAKHLFPEKRDNAIIQLIGTLIQDDCDIRTANENRIKDKSKK